MHGVTGVGYRQGSGVDALQVEAQAGQPLRRDAVHTILADKKLHPHARQVGGSASVSPSRARCGPTPVTRRVEQRRMEVGSGVLCPCRASRAAAIEANVDEETGLHDYRARHGVVGPGIDRQRMGRHTAQNTQGLAMRQDDGGRRLEGEGRGQGVGRGQGDTRNR